MNVEIVRKIRYFTATLDLSTQLGPFIKQLPRKNISTVQGTHVLFPETETSTVAFPTHFLKCA